MSELWDESMYGLDPDLAEIDAGVMSLVLLMVQAQQRARGDRLAATVDYPEITEEEVREWRN